MNRYNFFRFIFLVLMVLFPGLYAGVNNLRFEHLAIKDGLSNNNVRCILQDGKGFMWFGTLNGLNRFDGYQVKTYKHDPGNPGSLSNNAVWSLAEDRQGILWVGTEGGLNKYDRKRDRFTRYRGNPNDPVDLGRITIMVIYPDKKGLLWLGTGNNGLIRFDPGTGELTRYMNRVNDPGSLSQNLVRSIVQDKNGSLWVGTENGLNRLNPQTQHVTRYLNDPDNPNSLNNNFVWSLFADSAGILWIGTNGGGLNRFDTQAGQFSHYLKQTGPGNGLSSKMVFSLYEDQSGELWVGTSEGLNRMKDREAGGFINYRNHAQQPDSLSNNRVRSIYQDRQGMFWFGTWEGGVNILDKEKVKFPVYRVDPTTPNSLNDNAIFSIYQEPSGILWIGTWEGGLNKYDPETQTFGHYEPRAGDPNSLSSNSVRVIAKSRTGVFWIGTVVGGLNKFNPVTGTFTHYKHDSNNPNSISNNYINAIYEDQAGILWIGTRGGSLDRFDPVAGTFRHYKNDPVDPKSISNNYVTVIYEDRSGILWIGTMEGGLNQFDRQTNTFVHYKHDPNKTNSLGHNHIKSIYEDKSGFFWIGTAGGLNRFDQEENQWTLYTVKDGLPDNMIYGVLEDSQSNLWMSTNKGLSKFNPVRNTFINYTVRDGVQGDEFNSGGYFKNPLTGEMFFGGMNGLNRFYPGQVKDNTYPPPVVITAVKLSNQPVVTDISITELKEIRIPRQDNLLTIEFAAMNYRNRDENQYAYALDGVDQEWKYCGAQRFASYSNLKGGSYEFRVRASNDDGIWNNAGASIKIIVLPPFWETLWFQLSALLFVILSIFVIYRVRVRSIKTRKLALEQLVNERTRELKQRTLELEAANARVEEERRAAEAANKFKSDFLARMSHEIRTPMNAVIGFNEMLLDTGLNKEQMEYVKIVSQSGDSLLSLINDILDFSKVESGELIIESIDFDPEVMAYDVCDLMRPRIGDKPVEIICRISEKVPSNVKGDPGRYRQVLINLLANAVKFTEAGEIELSIDVAKEDESSIILYAKIRDTGIGIPKDQQDNIFKVFHQADGSTTRKYGGSGLGLSICKELAKLMNGDIWILSKPGRGSTFHFTARMQKSRIISVKRAAPVSLKNKKALVVDDNRHNLEILTRLLISAGMTVSALDRGTDVMTTLVTAQQNNTPFDICILDLRMPGLNGYQVAEQIRGPDSPCRNLPLVAYTSSYFKRSKFFKDSKFDGFLPKPVQRKKLIKMLEQLLGTVEEREEELKHHEIATRHSIVDHAKQSTCILLVEDNPINQKLAHRMLTKAGYHVEVANNGREAVEIYTSEPGKFDLIFMDVQMPEINGKEATRIIREEGFHHIPIIAMTAQAMKGDREKCLQAGMNDYIAKPIKREGVFEMVRKWALNNERGDTN
ncbi:MAG: response regulator [bacterium]|nr:response regulator [bacterium]